jgi:hypothetical protein
VESMSFQDFFDIWRWLLPFMMAFSLGVMHWTFPHEWSAKLQIAGFFLALMAPAHLNWQLYVPAYGLMLLLTPLFVQYAEHRRDQKNQAFVQISAVKYNLRQLKQLRPRTAAVSKQIAATRKDLEQLRRLPERAQIFKAKDMAVNAEQEAARLRADAANATKEALAVQHEREQAFKNLNRTTELHRS